jgi:hypothetical protein
MRDVVARLAVVIAADRASGACVVRMKLRNGHKKERRPEGGAP